MSALILVAEDDENQAELVRRYLEQDHHRVLVVHDGRDALDVVRIHQPELVVLDLMLPGLGGLDVCRALRAGKDQHDVLVLMLTARSTEDDLLHGLGIGADDYMTKPFSPRELVARVRTLLRRRPTARPAPLLEVGPIVVDQMRHEVTVRGEQVECTPGEFGLLEVLASEVDRVFTREQLLERMHGIDSFFTTRTIDTHVKNLRRKIESNARSPEHLVTVYGIGYKLTAGRRDAS